MKSLKPLRSEGFYILLSLDHYSLIGTSQIYKIRLCIKTCSNCSHIKQDLTLGDRVWTCEICGVSHDRDVNAAMNIKNMSLQKLFKIEAGKVMSDVSVKVGR